MLLDTQVALRAIHQELRTFLASSATTAGFPAATDGNPEPYSEFLCGVRLIKGAGEARLTLGSDRWLVLEGSVAELGECASNFFLAEEDGHTHLYTAPVSLIISADSAWGSELAS